jgi:hypothetical protein
MTPLPLCIVCKNPFPKKALNQATCGRKCFKVHANKRRLDVLCRVRELALQVVLGKKSRASLERFIGANKSLKSAAIAVFRKQGGSFLPPI